MAYAGSEGTAPLIRKLGTGWRRVVNLRNDCFPHGERIPVPPGHTAGCMGLSNSAEKQNRTHRRATSEWNKQECSKGDGEGE